MSYLPLSPSIFSKHSSCNSVLLIRQKRNRLLWQCPTQLGKPGTHLYALILLCSWNSKPRRSPLALSWGKMTCINANYLFHPLQCVQTCFFVLVAVFSVFTCFSATLELLYWEPGLPQGTPHVLKKVFSRSFQTNAERTWSLFMAKWKVQRQTQGLYAHYLVHRWVRSLLGLLTYDAGSHKGTFVHEWTPNCCCWGGKWWGMHYSATLLISLPPYILLLMFHPFTLEVIIRAFCSYFIHFYE